MPINPETLLNWPFAELEHSYTERDTVLYALGSAAARIAVVVILLTPGGLFSYF
jgi:hypothetical protein